MRGVYVAAAFRAEIKRARRYGRSPSRAYLMEETSLPPEMIERYIWSLEREGRP